MPRRVTVVGQFVRGETPVRGRVRFTPDQLWVIEEGVAWATLAPEAELWEDGRFAVELTASSWWKYLVETPAGEFHLRIPYREAEYTLKELIDVHHPGQRP